jgi:hypothetical protein
MQGNWHDDVGSKGICAIPHKSCQLIRKPRAERAYLLKFQQQDRLYQRVFVHGKASGAFKRVRFVLASRAEQ